MASADPQQQRSRPILVVADPRVVCLSYAAWMLWLLGYPDRALARVSEALALSEEMAHPHSLATATALMAWIHHFRGEAQAAQERAEAAISLSREQGFPLWTGLATIVRGWALAQQAQAAEGIAELGKGVAAWRATGAELSTPNYLAMLAESYAAVGQVDDGMRLLSEALATAQKTRERWGEAELYRVKGVLLSMGSPDAQAEADACFQQALDLARRQDAKSLELRAAVSASRLWQRQGRREAAQQVLAPVCQGFTEGFETSDVKGAKALLEALA